MLAENNQRFLLFDKSFKNFAQLGMGLSHKRNSFIEKGFSLL